MNICIFGDSIAKGYYDDKKGGWVNRVKEKLSSDAVYNLGISGYTTEDLIEKFDTDIFEKNPEVIIFAIGINDSEFSVEENKNLISLNKLRKNLNYLIEKSKKFTKNILFVGLNPVEEKKVSPIPWGAGGWHYLNSEIEKYNNAIKEICETENLKFINLFEEMVKINYQELLSDGIHPNSKGHQWMAEKIVEEIKK